MTTTPPPGWIIGTSIFDEAPATSTATINATRTGRWTWKLTLKYPGLECGSCLVLGSRERAARVAARKLLRFRRRLLRRSERFRVT